MKAYNPFGHNVHPPIVEEQNNPQESRQQNLRNESNHNELGDERPQSNRPNSNFRFAHESQSHSEAAQSNGEETLQSVARRAAEMSRMAKMAREQNGQQNAQQNHDEETLQSVARRAAQNAREQKGQQNAQQNPGEETLQSVARRAAQNAREQNAQPNDDKTVTQTVRQNMQDTLDKTLQKVAPQYLELQSKPIKAFGHAEAAGFKLDKLVTEPVITKDVPGFEAETSEKVINREREQHRLEFLAIKEKVKDIKISEIARQIGAHNKEDKIRDKWKMPWGHNVSIKGQKWYNHNPDSSHRSGGGAISFTKYIMGQEFGYDLDNKDQARKAEARGVYWLKETFGEEIDKSDIIAAKEKYEDVEREMYKPPQILDQYLPKVVEYLTVERSIPQWIVDKQIAAGKLYAGIPRQFERRESFDTFGKKLRQMRDLNDLQMSEVFCIFKSGDERLGAAECRCIKDETQLQFSKGFSRSSEKRLSNFFVVGEAGFEQKEVAMTEAAIDAMSYQALYPWAHVTSTGGTDNSDYMLKIAREVIEHPIYTLSIALDNDKAGEDCYDFLIKTLKLEYTEAVIDAHLTSGKIKRVKPLLAKDWNQELKENTDLAELYVPEAYLAFCVPNASVVQEVSELNVLDEVAVQQEILEAVHTDIAQREDSEEMQRFMQKRPSFTFDFKKPKI